MDPRELYKQTLLQHSSNPHNEGLMVDASHRAKLTNSLCGDEIEVYLKIEDQRIASVSFEAQCCSICKASASMLTKSIQDLDTNDAIKYSTKLIEAFTDAKQTLPLKPDDELNALQGVKDYPSRIRCATLPWEALKSAIDSTL